MAEVDKEARAMAAVIFAELKRQNDLDEPERGSFLFDDDRDLSSVCIDGNVNLLELAAAVIKGVKSAQ